MKRWNQGTREAKVARVHRKEYQRGQSFKKRRVPEFCRGLLYILSRVLTSHMCYKSEAGGRTK